jgi:hypothetical protein
VTASQLRQPVSPGEVAPDFALRAVDGAGTRVPQCLPGQEFGFACSLILLSPELKLRLATQMILDRGLLRDLTE